MNRGGAHFTRSELVTVLRQYQIGSIEDIQPLTRGNLRAPKKIIKTNTGLYLLKRRPHGKDDVYHVVFAHSIQLHLKKHGFPVAQIIPTENRNTALLLNEHVYEMFSFIEGVRYDRKESACRDAGCCLADFHKTVQGLEISLHPPHSSYHKNPNVVHQLEQLKQITSRSDKDLSTTGKNLFDLYGQTGERVDSLGYPSWPEQIVHADWHPGNMLFRKDQVVAVLDFDSAKIAPAVTDIANGLLQFSLVAGHKDPAQWPDHPDGNSMAAFAQGYQQKTKIEPEEIQAVPDLMIEALIAEAVGPVAVTGHFAGKPGRTFLEMILRKCTWIGQNRREIQKLIMQKT